MDSYTSPPMSDDIGLLPSKPCSNHQGEGERGEGGGGRGSGEEGRRRGGGGEERQQTFTHPVRHDLPPTKLLCL